MNRIISPIREKELENDNSPLSENGRNNTILKEPDNQIPFNKTIGETYIPSDANQRNTFIVFGRDRLGDETSGYGGRGHEKSSTIDLVVGRLSSFNATEHKSEYSNPNVGSDASRIYLSQKTDVDKNFGIVGGRTGKSAARAAVAIKSDDIRLVARNTIKIVTEKDSKLSADDPNFLLTGVQLIANNDDTNLQPIPKGEQLVRFILELQENIIELNDKVRAFMEIQRGLNDIFANHTHISPFHAQPTTPGQVGVKPLVFSNMDAEFQFNIKVDQGLNNHVNNLNSVVLKYISGGPDYINSRFHFLN